MSSKDEGIEYWEDFDDEVWDEEQWEFFMQEADRKAEEYLKKFEDELLSKKESLDSEEDGYYPSEERKPEEEQWKESGSAWFDAEAIDSFRHLAIWKTAHHFAATAHEYVDNVDPVHRFKDDFQTLAEQSLVVAAKIAGGHSMGYDREMLEGNIAYCKRGLKAAQRCIDALERIRIQHKPDTGLLKLYGLALQMRQEMREWIADLRRKIWWR
jgi:hypothetical protein